MALDLAAELVAALRSPSGRDALREALAPVVAAELQRVLGEQRETPRPLAEILGIGADAARKREARDAELRKLAIASGRRRLYLAHQVLEHMQRSGR